MKAAARLLLVLTLMAPSFASAQAQKAPAPSCRLFAGATIVNYNTKVRLDWSSKNTTGGYLTEVGTIPSNGFAFVVPGKNTTYAASFTGPGGTIVCRVGIVVQAGGVGSGSGATYGAGVLNVNGAVDVRATSIDTSVPVDANGNPINTGTGVNTSGSSVNTGSGVDTAPVGTGINTNQPINTTGNPINTGTGINTNQPVNLNGTVNLGGTITFPTAPVTSNAAAQTPTSGGLLGGLVPQECRGTSTVVNCDLCSLAQLGQNVANFLLGLTIPAAALLFAWAGILFFSSRGVPEQINRAKKIFMSVVIGFVIAVGAWVLVNTVMNMLVQGTDFKGWSWKSLSCAQTRAARLYDMSLSAYLTSSLPALQSYSGPTGGTAYQCTSGTLQGGVCVDGSGATVGSPVLVSTNNSGTAGGALGCSQYGAGYDVAGTQCVDGASGTTIGPALRPNQLTDAQQDQLQDECDDGTQASCAKLNAALGEISANAMAGVRRWDTQVSAACQVASMADCKVVQAIMANESGGNCNQVSGAGAVGCMQLMPTTACGIDPSLTGCSTCTNWNDNKGANCAAVKQALLDDPTRNITIGSQELSRLYNKYNGDTSSVAAAYNGGDKANNYSSVCGGGTAWQCTQNSGYAETRTYVMRVSNTLNTLK